MRKFIIGVCLFFVASTSYGQMTGVEMTTVQEINRVRVQRGMQPLQPTGAMLAESRRGAQITSSWGRAGHPLGIRTPAGFSGMSEISSSRVGSPSGAVHQWLGSSRHAAAMLDPSATHISVGESGGMYMARIGKGGRRVTERWSSYGTSYSDGGILNSGEGCTYGQCGVNTAAFTQGLDVIQGTVFTQGTTYQSGGKTFCSTCNCSPCMCQYGVTAETVVEEGAVTTEGAETTTVSPCTPAGAVETATPSPCIPAEVVTEDFQTRSIQVQPFQRVQSSFEYHQTQQFRSTNTPQLRPNIFGGFRPRVCGPLGCF